jgi:hypothetical protein
MVNSEAAGLLLRYLHEDVDVVSNERVYRGIERPGNNVAGTWRRIDHGHHCLALGLHEIKRVPQYSNGDTGDVLALY